MRISYAESPEKIQQIRDSITGYLQRCSPRQQECALSKLDEEAEKAFINLKVFTGNTLTNSYSESVNAQLRRFGVNTCGTRLFQIKLLYEFSYQFSTRSLKPFTPSAIMIEILDEQVLNTVANGTLSVVVTRIKRAQESCRFTHETPTEMEIEQDIYFNIKKLTIKKTVRHIVHWDSTIPSCSCNGITYSGMPCCHILCAAYVKHKKIPIDCFNKRFLDADHENPHAHDEGDETSDDSGARYEADDDEASETTDVNEARDEGDGGISADDSGDSGDSDDSGDGIGLTCGADASVGGNGHIEDDEHSTIDQEIQRLRGTPNTGDPCETSVEEAGYNSHMFNTYLLSTYNDQESYHIIAKFQLMTAQCLKARKSAQNKHDVDSFIKNLETQVKQQVEAWSGGQPSVTASVPHAEKPNRHRSFAEAPRQVQDLFNQELCNLLESQQKGKTATTPTTSTAVATAVTAAAAAPATTAPPVEVPVATELAGSAGPAGLAGPVAAAAAPAEAPAEAPAAAAATAAAAPATTTITSHHTQRVGMKRPHSVN